MNSTNSGIISVECPYFLGGNDESIAAAMVAIEKDRFRRNAMASGIEGVYFSGCPQELERLANHGELSVHVMSDEWDVLADSYLDLEDKDPSKPFQHWATLREGNFVIEAFSDALGEVSVKVRVEVSGSSVQTVHRVLPAQGYLGQWRMMISRIKSHLQ